MFCVVNDLHTFSDALAHTARLSFPLGETDAGEIVCADLADISHLLIAGASGTGKSIFINSLLLALIANNSEENLRLILCDTKMVELSMFNEVPHLLLPVCTNVEMIHRALQWVANETERRLRDFSTAGKKSLSSYNDYTWEKFIADTGLPQIVVVVDDFASALLEQPEMANSIRTILLNGRTTGVHLILSTQTPTWKAAKSISTLFRQKILFPVASKAESTTLIGSPAAFSVGGCGEAIYSNGRLLTRVKSILADAETSAGIIEKAKASEPLYSGEATRGIERLVDKEAAAKSMLYEAVSDYDELLPAAIDVVLEVGQASVSILQRRLKLGYGRAARLVDQMEENGIVGHFEGSMPRQLLITREQWQEMQCRQPLVRDGQNAEDGTAHREAEVGEIKNTDNEVPCGETKHSKEYKHRILNVLFGR